MTAIFVGAGGQLLPDHYVDAARPAVFTGAAVLLAATVVALWLPSGKGALADGGAAVEAHTAAPEPVAA
jgi:hypothetical protein